MDNFSNGKAILMSEVDHLPIGSTDSSNLGIAEVSWVDSVPHVCENQVRTSEAAVHLTEQGNLLQISFL